MLLGPRQIDHHIKDQVPIHLDQEDLGHRMRKVGVLFPLLDPIIAQV